jgi:hypothetical protein
MAKERSTMLARSALRALSQSDVIADTFPDEAGVGSRSRTRTRPECSGFGMKRRGTDIGHDLFRAACNMNLEGIVSKRLDRAYGAGRCNHWLKIKKRAHPAYSSLRDVLIRASEVNF